MPELLPSAQWLVDAFGWTIPVAGGGLLVRELVGNLFGLASALGGMARRTWAWPVGILGNVLLLTVFVASLFGGADHATLLGQAGRQLMFIAVSAYGWARWRRGGTGEGAAITPAWAGPWGKALMLLGLPLGTVALTPVFRALGSWEPVWADAWTFVGSLLATWGMARGWVEFWLVWVAVDLVGVPLLWHSGYYASAVMYAVYGAFTLTGFVVWLRAARHAKPAVETLLPDGPVPEAIR